MTRESRSQKPLRFRRSRKPLAVLGGGALVARHDRRRRPRRPRRHRPAVGAAPARASACSLAGGSIKHVIYLQFDNVHYTRDNPNVPSDLEQMPSLLKFITGSGTLISQEHTPLIAHTADDIVTSESGLYGSDQGIPIANEYQYYTGAKDGSTDEAGRLRLLDRPDRGLLHGLRRAPRSATPAPPWSGQNGKTPPAPWVSYTRAGLRLRLGRGGGHRAGEQAPDVPLVFGANSRRRQGGRQPASCRRQGRGRLRGSVRALRARLRPCARTTTRCADLLPDEPGGYHGYRALFGAKYLDPLMSPSRAGQEPQRRRDQGLLR